jgi:hypothetical protein
MFYFRPTSDNCNITISNLNRNNGFLLDDIKVQVIETSPMPNNFIWFVLGVNMKQMFLVIKLD